MLKDSSDKAATATSEIKKPTATFADNVLTLAGGTTIALGVTVLASPITSRLFGPEAFGLGALFQSGVVMFAAIARLRYEMAMVLPKNNEDAALLFAICGVALMALTTLTAILTYVFGTRLLLHLKAVELAPILWLFPVSVFLRDSQLPCIYWYTRQKQFKINAANGIISIIPISLAEIAGGWAGFRTGGNLVVLRIFGLIFAPAFLMWRLLNSDARFIFRNFNYSKMIKLARRYSKFPVLDTWSILLEQLSISIPIFLTRAMPATQIFE